MGIPTPPSYLPVVSLARCGWVLVPGLAFDDDGRRLGYGRGYYDRALSLVDPERCIGLLLDEQRVPRVPVEAYDVRLRWTCSPRGLMSHPPS